MNEWAEKGEGGMAWRHDAIEAHWGRAAVADLLNGIEGTLGRPEMAYAVGLAREELDRALTMLCLTARQGGKEAEAAYWAGVADVLRLVTSPAFGLGERLRERLKELDGANAA